MFAAIGGNIRGKFIFFQLLKETILQLLGLFFLCEGHIVFIQFMLGFRRNIFPGDDRFCIFNGSAVHVFIHSAVLQSDGYGKHIIVLLKFRVSDLPFVFPVCDALIADQFDVLKALYGKIVLIM